MKKADCIVGAAALTQDAPFGPDVAHQAVHLLNTKVIVVGIGSIAEYDMIEHVGGWNYHEMK